MYWIGIGVSVELGAERGRVGEWIAGEDKTGLRRKPQCGSKAVGWRIMRYRRVQMVRKAGVEG
jgi:hypothetical protein